MKKLGKILAVVIFGVIGSAKGFGETHYQPHISVGGHAGADLSRISFSPEVPQTWLPGPTFGVQVRYAEEKIVGVMAELNFVNRGWKETFEENPELSYSRTLSYISLPIMTHISFGSSRVKCFFNLGPEFGFLLSSKISSNFDYHSPSGLVSSTRRVNQMSMEIANRLDYGITAGLGIEYYVNPRNSIFIEGRYYFGLGNIFSATKADEFGASRSMSISVTLGYNFRLK